MYLTADYWGSVGSGICFTTGYNILLVKRSREVREPGTWGFPGGKVNRGENPIDAAVREVKEELGRIPKIRQKLGVSIYKDEGFTYYTYIMRISEDIADRWEFRLNWENSRADWFRREELPKPLHFGVVNVLANKGSLIWEDPRQRRLFPYED